MLCKTLITLAAAALGCSPAKPSPPAVVEPAMVFPMIVVFPGKQLVIWHDASDFKTMHTNILNNPSLGDPVLIDGKAGIFDVREMSSTKGGAWHMLNPVAMSPITFKLTRREPSGIAAARELIAGCEHLTGSGDEPEIRRHITAAASVAEIIKAFAGGETPATKPDDNPPHS